MVSDETESGILVDDDECGAGANAGPGDETVHGDGEGRDAKPD